MPDLPAIERAVSARWAQTRVFARWRTHRRPGPVWSPLSEPTAASGVPDVEYTRTRAISDIYPRFAAMRGFDVALSHGWDCHELGVELAVMAGLGLTGTDEIEAYGLAPFVARCRESAAAHASVFAAVGARMGCLDDLGSAFRTMDASYVESTWWSLKWLFDAGLLIKDYRIGRYCPGCQSQLAEHELRRPHVYDRVTDTAVIVRLRLHGLGGTANLRLGGADLLAWTTAPWTLAASTGVAVRAGETYALARRAGHGERVILAERSFARVLGDGWHVAATVTGAELAGARCDPPFRPAADRPAPAVHVDDDAVPAGCPTGIAVLAPAFGVGPLAGDPTSAVDPLGPDGRFDQTIPALSGLFFASSSQAIAADLSDRGLLFGAYQHARTVPRCWRCGTRVLTKAMTSWYISTAPLRDRLRDLAGHALWQSADGGFALPGGATDWAVSRTRYWGVPLPLWECPSGHVTCVGSLTELSELAGLDLLGLDPHRPAVDHVRIRCRECGTWAQRVTETLDASYDIGALPFARVGAPLRGPASVDAGYPADLAIDGGGHGRSWLYALIAVGAIVDGRPPFLAAIRSSGTHDAHGRRLSARHGNLIEPLPLIERHGADAIRWFFAALPPGRAARVSDAAIDQVVRQVLRPYLSAAMFYLGRAGSRPGRDHLPGHSSQAARRVLDRWLLSELHCATREVTGALEEFRSDLACRRLQRLVAGLTKWYVPLYGRRLVAADQPAASLASLRDCLDTLTRLMAPVAPFLTDYVWALIRDAQAPDSVHLASWPTVLPGLIDEQLSEAMATARGIVRVGRAARAAAKVGARQPLAQARIAGPGLNALTPELLALVADELHVDGVEVAATAAELADTTPPGWVIASKPTGTVAIYPGERTCGVTPDHPPPLRARPFVTGR